MRPGPFFYLKANQPPCRSCILLDQQLGFVLLQRAASGLVALKPGLRRQFWEQLEDFVALTVANTFQAVITRLEAFRPCTVRQNHFVAVEHEVDIGRAHHVHFVDAFGANQVLGSRQNFPLFEVELGLIGRHEAAVVRADQHITLWQTIPKGTGTDHGSLGYRCHG